MSGGIKNKRTVGKKECLLIVKSHSGKKRPQNHILWSFFSLASNIPHKLIVFFKFCGYRIYVNNRQQKQYHI